MPYYSEDLIEKIRSSNDIVDVIGSVVRLKRSGSNYFGLCPFHNEKTGSFCVTPSKQIYYCFGCGAGGNVISFVMEYEHYGFQEAIKFLGERAGIALPEAEATEEEKRAAWHKKRILECLKTCAVFYYKRLYQPEGKIGLEYLKKRGLSDETIKNFGLGYSGKGYDQAVKYLKSKGYTDQEIMDAGLCTISEKHGMSDRFFNRVMFPIMDINSKVIGFGGRVMGDGEPKYLNSPETPVFDKSHNMYGLNVARRSNKGYRIVCEGYMDVISMHQAGFTEAVASLGTAFTSGHANLLRRYTKDVRLTYDSDNAGQKAAMRAIPICRSAGLHTKVIHMDPYKDPDEFIKGLGAEEFQKRIDEAENSFYFELSYAQKSYDMSDPEGRTAFQEEVAKKLASIEDELQRDNYIQAVAAKYSIREEVLRRAVALAAERGDFEEREGRYSLAGNRDSYEKGSKKKEEVDGLIKAESYLLTWMTDEEEVYKAASGYIEPSDFSEGVTKRMAEAIFEGYRSGNFSPADILTHFTEEDLVKEASRIINTPLDGLESVSEKEKALTDLVIRIKTASLDRLKNADDGTDPLKKAKEIRKAMDELKKIRITL